MIDYLLSAYRLSFTLQLLAAELLFLLGQRHRKHFLLRLAGGVAVYLLFAMKFPDRGDPVIGSTIIYATSMIPAFLCINESWQHILFLCFNAGLLQNLALNLGKIFMLSLALGGGPALAADLLAFLAVYSAGYVFLARRGSYGDALLRQTENKLSKVLMSVSACSILMALNTLFGANGLDDNLYCRIALLCSGGFLLAIQFLLLKMDQLSFEKALIDRMLRSEREKYQMSRTNIDLINMKYHDIKHLVTMLRKSGTPNEGQVLQEIEDAANLYDAIAKTGNETLDTILTEKSLYCRSQGISLTYIVDSRCLAAIEPMDLYALFGNAIDNAIESVVEAPESRRLISLRVTGQLGMAVIHLENYCPSLPDFLDGMPLTTKADRDNHGFGVKSIRYLAEKYHGNASFRVEYGMFKLDIMLPMGNNLRETI